LKNRSGNGDPGLTITTRTTDAQISKKCFHAGLPGNRLRKNLKGIIETTFHNSRVKQRKRGGDIFMLNTGGGMSSDWLILKEKDTKSGRNRDLHCGGGTKREELFKGEKSASEG